MISHINTAFARTLENGEIDSYVAHHGFGIMGGFPMMFFGWIFMFLFLALVILVVLALIKYIKS